MEVTQGRKKSKAQAETGLENGPWNKFLHVTLKVAKELTKGMSVEQWNWKEIDWPRQDAAINDVIKELEAQGINIAREHVKKRFQTAIKDLKTKESQRLEEIKKAEAGSAKDNDKRPYDPIRDV